MKRVLQIALVGLLIAAPLVTPASADTTCEPEIAFDYTASRAVVTMKLHRSECGPARSVGDVIMKASIERCGTQCSEAKERTVCGVAREWCRLTIRSSHPTPEMADYTMSTSYSSSGKKVVGGLGTIRRTCYSFAVDELSSCS